MAVTGQTLKELVGHRLQRKI